MGGGRALWAEKAVDDEPKFRVRVGFAVEVNENQGSGEADLLDTNQSTGTPSRQVLIKKRV